MRVSIRVTLVEVGVAYKVLHRSGVNILLSYCTGYVRMLVKRKTHDCGRKVALTDTMTSSG